VRRDEVGRTRPSQPSRGSSKPARHRPFSQLVETVECLSGRTGRVSHSPRAIMRLLSVVLRPINGMRAGQVQAALVMDTTDMALDVTKARSADPAVPLSQAAGVAARMFGRPVPVPAPQPA
jgi:hypothetical protein